MCTLEFELHDSYEDDSGKFSQYVSNHLNPYTSKTYSVFKTFIFTTGGSYHTTMYFIWVGDVKLFPGVRIYTDEQAIELLEEVLYVP